jgi:hypothetical protein
MEPEGAAHSGLHTGEEAIQPLHRLWWRQQQMPAHHADLCNPILFVVLHVCIQSSRAVVKGEGKRGAQEPGADVKEQIL